MAKRLSGKLNCSVEDLQIFYQHVGAILVASKMLEDYLNSVSKFPGSGPELYAEVWMKLHLCGNREDCENLGNIIIVYFVQMLRNTSKSVSNDGK